MQKTRYPVGRHLLALQADAFSAFALPLKDRDGPLYCEQILKLYRGQRATFRGRFGTRDCLVKVFFNPRRHKVDCTQELNGLAQLASAGCVIPELIYVGPSSDHAASVLVLEWQAQAVSVSAAFVQGNDEQRRQLLIDLMEQFARQHLAGCWQADIHPSNFLVNPDNILCVDGERITQFPSPVISRIGNDNIARFLAQWPARYDDGIREALTHYCRRRFGDSNDKWMKQLRQQIAHYRQQRWRQQIRLQQAQQWLHVDHSQHSRGMIVQHMVCEDWKTFLSNPQQHSRIESASHPLQWDNAIQLRIVQRRSWREAWSQSGGQRAFRHAYAMQMAEIDCVTPIAWVESWQEKPPLSLFLYQSMVSSAEAARLMSCDHQHVEQYADQVSDILQQLFALQLYCKTYILQTLAGDGQHVVIQQPESWHHSGIRWWFHYCFGKNLQQLLRDDQVPDAIRARWREQWPQRFPELTWPASG